MLSRTVCTISIYTTHILVFFVMAAAAAAAAMARQEASKLSISELKEKLRAGNVDTSGCFEKTDLINLYVRTVGRTKFEPEVNNRPRARPPPQRR